MFVGVGAYGCRVDQEVERALWFSFLFFFLSIYYLSVCVYYVCANMCCGVHVEVRGQLRVVGSPFLPLYRFWR